MSSSPVQLAAEPAGRSLILAQLARKLLSGDQVTAVDMVDHPTVGVVYICSVTPETSNDVLCGWVNRPSCRHDVTRIETPHDTSMRVLGLPPARTPDSSMSGPWLGELAVRHGGESIDPTHLGDWKEIQVLAVGQNWRSFTYALDQLRVGEHSGEGRVFSSFYWNALTRHAKPYDFDANAFWPSVDEVAKG